MKFKLKQMVNHVPSGMTYLIVGLTIDGQALIDLGGEGVFRAWVPCSELEAA